MSDFIRPLGNAVRKARVQQNLTQGQVAERIGIDQRTVLNIENHKGNPKFEILFPLIRTLQIDPSEIFYPELKEESPALRQLQLLIADCSTGEAEDLVAMCKSVLPILRARHEIPIN